MSTRKPPAKDTPRAADAAEIEAGFQQRLETVLETAPEGHHDPDDPRTHMDPADWPAEDDAEVQAIVDDLAAEQAEYDAHAAEQMEALAEEAAELAAREQRVVDILLDLVRVANGERGEHGAITFSDFAQLVITAVEQ